MPNRPRHPLRDRAILAMLAVQAVVVLLPIDTGLKLSICLALIAGVAVRRVANDRRADKR